MFDDSAVVPDHVAGLRAAVAWLDEHPAFASILTHTTVSAHIDSPMLFASALRSLGPDAERRETDTQAQARVRLHAATLIRVTVPLSVLPLVPTGEMQPVMARAWPR